MKTVEYKLYIFSLFIICSACGHIYFSQVQPAGGVLQPNMPKDLFGQWVGDNQETWKIDEKGITSIAYETDSLKKKIIDTVYQTIPLSDTVRLYKADELYFLNVMEDGKYWELFGIFKPMMNGEIYFYPVIDNPKDLTSIEGLKLEEAKYYDQKQNKFVNSLSVKKDLNDGESVRFSGQMKLTSLKKQLKNWPLLILKKDGSVSSKRIKK